MKGLLCDWLVQSKTNPDSSILPSLHKTGGHIVLANLVTTTAKAPIISATLATSESFVFIEILRRERKR